MPPLKYLRNVLSRISPPPPQENENLVRTWEFLSSQEYPPPCVETNRCIPHGYRLVYMLNPGWGTVPESDACCYVIGMPPLMSRVFTSPIICTADLTWRSGEKNFILLFKMLKLKCARILTAIFVLPSPFSLLLCARIAEFIVSEKKGRQLYKALGVQGPWLICIESRKAQLYSNVLVMFFTCVQQVLAAPSSWQQWHSKSPGNERSAQKKRQVLL